VDSLRRRVFFKTGGNGLAMALGMAQQMIIPRGLGPAAFGDYSFLVGFFSQAIGFLDGGASTHFFVSLSRRPREAKLFKFAILTCLVAGAAVVASSFLAGWPRVGAWIWPGQSGAFVAAAAVLAATVWTTNLLGQFLDAYGQTIRLETIRAALRAASIVVLLILHLRGWLSSSAIYVWGTASALLLALVYGRLLRRFGAPDVRGVSLTSEDGRRYGRELWSYAGPLYLLGLGGFLTGAFDRWFLQRAAGSAEQGFYGLSFQVGSLSLIFASALANLLMREFAVAHEENQGARIRELFCRHAPLAYGMTAFASAFVLTHAETFGVLFGGREFGAAATPIAVMSLYPVHQTYGQLTGSLFLATGKTRQYRDLGLMGMGLSMMMTLYLLAPREWGGLSGGATGLAVKMVVSQFLSVNLLLFVAAREFRFSFWNLMGRQIVTLSACVGMSWLSARLVPVNEARGALGLTMSALLYGLFGAALLHSFPQVLGLSRERWRALTSSLRARLRGRRGPEGGT
jgi:O-antigen/teichoic acid export membrane protein